MLGVLERFSWPDNYISLVRALHENTSRRVLYQRKLSEEFEITCGVKQGYVMAPTPLGLYFTAMMHKLPSDNPDVDIRELQFVDDNAAFCHSVDNQQQSVNNFTAAYQLFGMSVNIQKTKVLAQLALRTPLPEFDITISGTSLEQVDQFSFLGSLPPSATRKRT
ncbi:uncharacterized protein LOC143038976 [Oratosquilla oratoria]|uniref:uncharacterized protein LOC143038976 n=1 Tax=Oratosquilla oratoria TaxID=337810 RepID=UPI003F774995